MYPNLFGIEDFSYALCLLIGIGIAFTIAIIFLKKRKITKAGVIDLLICACFAVVLGLVFAILFENIYEMIEKGKEYQITSRMTFFGGLFGGVIGFLLTYYFMRKNINFDLLDVVKIAPICIAIAHAIGRIGCFLAGCCYGIETDSCIGVDFPNDIYGKVIPTQLIESIFLFILFGVMLFLLIKKDFKYNFIIYMSCYGIFRFVIEFFRGDERGVAFFLSPSQVWSIILIFMCTPTYLFLKRNYEKE